MITPNVINVTRSVGKAELKDEVITFCGRSGLWRKLFIRKNIYHLIWVSKSNQLSNYIFSFIIIFSQG